MHNLLLGMLILLFSVLTGSGSSDLQTKTDHPHPFEPCPDTPNCVIESVEYDLPHSELCQRIEEALKKMEPHELSVKRDTHRFDAVFRIALFGFKDDVTIAVEKLNDSKSVLHIKSASRVGYSDLGVNSRRVKRFFKHLEQLN